MRQAIIAVAVAAMLFTATCGGHQRNGAQPSGLTSTNASPVKTASLIPADVRLIARDAGIALSAGGYTLAWKYANPADYNQDGIVALEDLAQLTEHFNEAATPANEWIDGSRDGAIGVADITPIAMNWGSEVTGYRIDGAVATDGAWSEVAQLTLDEGDASGGRLAFSLEITPGFTYYRIVTLTPGGDAASSDTLVAPSNEPIIYGVTPTSGYQHEEYTFTATASGQEPLTYVWDFGGGATPNTSSDLSPIVTLSDAGEYSATLTISNSYGPATFPFTLTVSARDTWAHTWGGSISDRFAGMALDNAGNIYVLADTNGFGSTDMDFVLLKYSPAGELFWAKSWSSTGYDHPKACISAEDGILAVGYTNGAGVGLDDLLLLKYSESGDLLWQKTWGTPDYDRAEAAATDASGNIYVVGNELAFGGLPDALIVKLSPNGEIIWARTWGGESSDIANSVIALSDKLLVGGTTSSFGAGDEDGFLLELDNYGNVEWAKTYGGSGGDFTRLALVEGDSIFLAGSTESFGQGRSDCMAVKCDAEGNPIWTHTWGSSHSEGIASLVNKNGKLFGVGWMTYYGDSVFTLAFDEGGWPITGCRWYGKGSKGYSAVIGGEGSIFIGGVAPSNAGEWSATDGIASEITLSVTNPTKTINAIEGLQTTPEGTGIVPMGIIDTGGGRDDVLIMKNFPM